jgi:hypothetical protein
MISSGSKLRVYYEIPLNFWLYTVSKAGQTDFLGAYRIFASSLLIRFSSNSRARAFLRSAMNFTKPKNYISVHDPIDTVLA